MLEDIEVFQQPAGFVDEIIMVWHLQLQAKRYPQCLHQRDLFAASLTETSQKACYLGQQVQTFIAGKMTPALQLTDTDVSRPLKAKAERTNR